jgi:hypothetical protein
VKRRVVAGSRVDAVWGGWAIGILIKWTTPRPSVKLRPSTGFIDIGSRARVRSHPLRPRRNDCPRRLALRCRSWCGPVAPMSNGWPSQLCVAAAVASHTQDGLAVGGPTLRTEVPAVDSLRIGDLLAAVPTHEMKLLPGSKSLGEWLARRFGNRS